MKKRISLENDNSHKEEDIDKLENQLKEDKFTLSESERKYDDIARKLSTKVCRGEEGQPKIFLVRATFSS